MMPVMDGPATLARLRESPQTVDTPIIFMTARAQTREIEHLRSLGAAGIIAKPFDPMTLGDAIRQQLQATAIAASRERFLKRTQTDVTRLTEHMAILSDDPKSPRALEEIKTIAHGLAGTGGIFGLEELSCVASTLEQAVIDEIAGEGMSGAVMQQLDAVIKHLIHPA
jgi:DNA-binding NarL/FixJ family response regulator